MITELFIGNVHRLIPIGFLEIYRWDFQNFLLKNYFSRGNYMYYLHEE